MADDVERGRFVWHDLLTSDPPGAIDFYSKVTGWTTEQWNAPSGPPYTMWKAGNSPMGGVTSMPQQIAGAPPHWIAHVVVPDADATARQVTELGGRVLQEPMTVPTVGRMAVIADPQGASISVFTPESPTPGRDAPPTRGEFSWHELLTTDYNAAFDFYHALFGWEKIDTHDMGAAGVYLIYGRNGKPLGGMFNGMPGVQVPPNWLCYVDVDDAGKAADRVEKNGGKVLNGPMEVPGGGHIAQCSDPQGAMFAVHSLPA